MFFVLDRTTTLNSSSRGSDFNGFDLQVIQKRNIATATQSIHFHFPCNVNLKVYILRLPFS